MKPNIEATFERLASIAILGALFATCQGSARASLNGANTLSRLTSPTGAALRLSSSDASGAEHLIGTATLIKPCHQHRNGSWSTGFSASGTATGPKPGTFTAAGAWGNGGLPVPNWYVDGSFSITSGSSTIDGTFGAVGVDFGGPTSCTAVEKFSVGYMTPIASGNAKISVQAGSIHVVLLRF
jgi:hypothetical protein